MPGGADLYYEEHGRADAPPLILSSGLGGSAAYWRPNIADLARHFRVIAYDHRGTGRSDRALPEHVTLADLGADMLALMDRLGIARAAIIGHAIGGMAALEAARAAPERVERIVIINGWARLDPQTARCFDVRLALLRHAGPAAYLEAQPLFLFPPDWLSEHDAALRKESEHHLAHWPGDAAMEKRIAAARRFDAMPWLHHVVSPVLAISAADDLLVPWRNAQALVQALPQSVHRHFDWGGHALNVTASQRFNRDTLDWLTSGAAPIGS
ncbi:pyrimidine utilization protein D [Novosphingobium sp. KACC 22771]|uniref:pyrimidine utilization protein D n=1 Tax=Novosphingobium sp. KACC 22771 TaxID=3025670 RepID=UPI0023661754|nr:pyrimidine utilization protein D [Novosphingobium sp. KACC 22771]WDF74804.1 pyrimidine utilization protein D [Novosphingobium sp. KACC 22771]